MRQMVIYRDYLEYNLQLVLNLQLLDRKKDRWLWIPQCSLQQMLHWWHTKALFGQWWYTESILHPCSEMET